MKTQRNKFSFGAIGLGLLIFAFTFLSSISFLLLIELFLTRLTVVSESTATQTIGTIRTCQMSYASKHQGKFALTFAELVSGGCLDQNTFTNEQPVINGYIFTIQPKEPSVIKPSFYSINVDPQPSDESYSNGNRHFYYDSNLGATKSTDENRPATADDPSI